MRLYDRTTPALVAFGAAAADCVTLDADLGADDLGGYAGVWLGDACEVVAGRSARSAWDVEVDDWAIAVGGAGCEDEGCPPAAAAAALAAVWVADRPKGPPGPHPERAGREAYGLTDWFVGV